MIRYEVKNDERNSDKIQTKVYMMETKTVTIQEVKKKNCH